MTARHTKRGKDVLTSPPQTQWQRARASGPILPILPMQPARRSWLGRVFGR
jgi:hypothetical protein